MDKYEGDTKGGKKHGKETFTYTNGDKYIGEWKDDKKHGQGACTWPNGDAFVGEWKDDEPSGQGTYTCSESPYYGAGGRYVGTFRNGSSDGQGTFTYANGDEYVGEWKDEKRNGQGTFTTDESIETGLWKNDLLAKGKCTLREKFKDKDGKWEYFDGISVDVELVDAPEGFSDEDLPF